jgi:NADH-quinone oxidoreductase subunit N
VSAPLIWIVLPALASLVFFAMRKRASLVILLSTALCLFLALLAWVLPVGTPIHVGPLSFQIGTTLAFLGRRLALQSSDMPFLVFINILCAFWFAGSHAAGADRLLIPFGLGIVSLLIAAMAVEPFLYAALLIEMAVLLAIPLLVSPGTRLGQGVLRFLIFQTLAMPFILLAGWALGEVQANPSNQTLVLIATAFIALGFAFWLAVFPFYTWVPLLAEQAYPYITGFLFLILPSVELLLGLGFLDQFGWLRGLPSLYAVIGQVGVLMIITAGVWAGFQKDLARLMGYGVIVETGFSLMAVSLRSQIGMDLFASMFLPRMIGLGLWALTLSILVREAGSGRFERVTGLGRKMPFAVVGLGVAALSLGGLPLLAVYPIRQILLEEIAKQSLLNSVWALAGMVGMMFSTFRALFTLSRVVEEVVPAAQPVPSQPLISQQPTSQPPAATAAPAAATAAPAATIPSAPSALPQTGPLKLSQTGPLKLPEVKPAAPRYCETPMQILLIIGGIVLLVLIGIFPQAFLPLTHGLIEGFANLP